MHMHKNTPQLHEDMEIQVQENNQQIQWVFQDQLPMVLNKPKARKNNND